MPNLNRRLLTTACLTAFAWPMKLMAQDKYPTRTIRFICPSPPGGLSDTIPRILAPELSAAMNTTVVVENRAGAGGSIGTSAMARSAPDGYTLLLGTGGTMTLNPYLLPNQTYDSSKDFLGIALVASTPLYLVVRPDSPYRTLGDLIAAAKAAPGQLAYGNLGNGSTAAIAGALLSKAKGLDFIDVPYSGYAPGLSELLAGRLAFFFVDGSSLARIEHGSLRALAVTSARRASRLPNVPSMKEQGVDVDVSLWFGVYTRAGVPPEVAQRLRDEVKLIVERPAFRAQLAGYGLEPGGLYGDAFQAYHLAELKRWGETLPALGIKAQS